MYNGVSMCISSCQKSIDFKWSVSKNELSITHSLNNILEENKIIIINNCKNNFNNKLREEMKLVAAQGKSKGKFSYYSYDTILRILDIDKCDLCKWLIDKTLEEQEDLKGIDIYLDPNSSSFSGIIFKW
jgi:hypothetical protein